MIYQIPVDQITGLGKYGLALSCTAVSDLAESDLARYAPPLPYPINDCFGRQRPRSAFNSSLALCKIIEPREAKKQRAMYGASLAVNQRAVTRFCPQQVRRQEKRQAAVISSIQDCTSDYVR